ncbi:MAG: C10 family peptidase, partial [Candidatus Marinimicrobia bacterium]|nr:C10 family peptidase [Candidatus Neomarinimicrobiota bacterium]
MKHFNHKLISFFFLYFATQSLKASGLSELCTVSQIGDAPGIIFLNTPTWGTGSVNGNIVFNFFTPNYWSAGCVATSMAEVMAYFQWPLSGTGLVSYQEDDAGNLSVNFGVAEYYLDKVLDDYTGGYTSEQRDLAAQISYHAAISVKMDFESLGSTASTRDIDDALKKYFCYSASYTSDLDKLVADIKKNIQSGHPGIISLEYIDSYGNKHGHAVVADGYSEAYGYHLNMGWNGNSANGWYDIEGTFNAGGYDTVTGGVVDIIPIPAIDKEITWYSEDSARVSWSVSPKLQSDYYQVQLLAPSGIWEIIADTLYNQNTLVCLNETGTWSVRVRGYYDGRYCDFSESYKIKMGSDVEVVFTIDMGSELMAGNEW